MQSDCEIYVDPEEDEVFFGCVSEREKTVCAKLVNHAGSSPKNERKLNNVLDGCNPLNVEENIEDILKNVHSTKVPEEITLDGTNEPTEPDIKDSLEKSQDSKNCKIVSNNNTSVELEHNYSTPMKHKIDKSILTTPKSVVKADKDGGFLKVLSEIALVKAEAEADKKLGDKREDEDKENKHVTPIPEIKITEATPEKGSVYSPPKSVSTELRRFRIIYNSPQEDNVDCKGKSNIETFESERNFKNKCLDREVEALGIENRKSIDLIDFNDLTNFRDLNEPFEKKGTQTETDSNEDDKSVEIITGEKKPTREIIAAAEPTQPRTELHSQHSETRPADRKPISSMRFSKEARKIVEVLKKSTADDTLNFTIPEIDVEEEENSFVSPEPISGFDETVIHKVPVPQPEKTSPRILIKPADNRIAMRSKSVEKDRRKLTPVSSQSKLQPMKYFTERRIYNHVGGEKSKCVKKLPVEEKRPPAEAKTNGGKMPESRIPVFGVKNSKIPPAERLPRGPLAKTTPSKPPSGKSNKNSKFNHIESPINVYIHSKPSPLVLNVKPEAKKDGLSKVLRTHGIEKKIQEKAPKVQNPVKLPFVEYKSATPYKIEKRPESRLPRLAPAVMKLIGSHSPKVLKHEGRFYVNTPRKQTSTENTTIVADPNEVSVVVSQPVQKSNTIK